MLVKELMKTKVYFVVADSPIRDVISLMKNYDIGIVPVCDNTGALMGVITDRDIILRCPISGSFDNGETPVARDIMSENIASVNSTAEIHDAAVVFAKKRVHRLPVLENGKLAGILSVSDLAGKRIFLAEVGEIIGSISE
ncbi:MAG: CBS domain-containing protein [Emergencia sp.]